ncbi:MAG: glycosyl transferase, partial [Betaproteobacteria bacterium]|nr:glycosyl transferase [Betaproteobacteria bacterium]
MLDPQPEAVWREFVVGENMGKMNDAQGYWTQLLSFKGAGAYALAHVENAGLLAPGVLGVYALAWR